VLDRHVVRPAAADHGAKVADLPLEDLPALLVLERPIVEPLSPSSPSPASSRTFAPAMKPSGDAP
jgi:hypothetical protein